MSEIRNEIEFKKQKREERKIDQLKKAGKTKDEIEKEMNEYRGKQPEKKEVVHCKTLVDNQKRKLDRLMNNPVNYIFFITIYIIQFDKIFIYIDYLLHNYS